MVIRHPQRPAIQTLRYFFTIAVVLSLYASAFGESQDQDVGEGKDQRTAILDYLFDAASAIQRIEAWPKGRASGKVMRRGRTATGEVIEDYSTKFQIDWDGKRSYRELWIVDHYRSGRANPARDDIAAVTMCKRILLNEAGSSAAIGSLDAGTARIIGAMLAPPDMPSGLMPVELVAPYEYPLSFSGILPISAIIESYRKQSFTPVPNATSDVTEEGSVIVLRILSGESKTVTQELRFDKSLEGRLVKYDEFPVPGMQIFCRGSLQWSRDKHGFLYLQSHQYQRFMSEAPQRPFEEHSYEVAEYDSAPEFDIRSFHQDRLEIPKGTPVQSLNADPSVRPTSSLWGIEGRKFGDKSVRIDELVERLRSRGFSNIAREGTK